MEIATVTVKNLYKCLFKNQYSYSLSISLKYQGGEIEDYINKLQNEYIDKEIYISNKDTYKNITFYLSTDIDIIYDNKKSNINKLDKIINSKIKNNYVYDLVIKPYISKDNKSIRFKLLKIKISS